MIPYLIMAVVVAAFAIVFFTILRIAIKREQAIYNDGLQADSIVSRHERYSNGDGKIRFRCYVKYTGNDGREHEGLLNVRSDLPIGRKVKIMYIPGNYDEVVFVSQELS